MPQGQTDTGSKRLAVAPASPGPASVQHGMSCVLHPTQAQHAGAVCCPIDIKVGPSVAGQNRKSRENPSLPATRKASLPRGPITTITQRPAPVGPRFLLPSPIKHRQVTALHVCGLILDVTVTVTVSRDRPGPFHLARRSRGQERTRWVRLGPSCRQPPGPR
jgi:hypothetical protein